MGVGGRGLEGLPKHVAVLSSVANGDVEIGIGALGGARPIYADAECGAGGYRRTADQNSSDALSQLVVPERMLYAGDLEPEGKRFRHLRRRWQL